MTSVEQKSACETLSPHQYYDQRPEEFISPYFRDKRDKPNYDAEQRPRIKETWEQALIERQEARIKKAREKQKAKRKAKREETLARKRKRRANDNGTIIYLKVPIN